MRPMRSDVPFTFVALVAAASVAGCGKNNPAAPPSGAGYMVGGKALTTPARYIVSLSPSATEVLAQNGASRFIVGRTASCNYPTFVRKYPVIMTGTKPDYEKVMKLLVTPEKKPVKPDLFVYDKDLFCVVVV